MNVILMASTHLFFSVTSVCLKQNGYRGNGYFILERDNQKNDVPNEKAAMFCVSGADLLENHQSQLL